MADKAEQKLQKPAPTNGDALHTIARAGLSAIPFVGGAAVELFSAVIKPPLERRRNAWIESIAARLQELEEKVDGFRIEDLSRNEKFITTALQATQAALRNHQKEKLDALRNIVINSAQPNSLDEDLQLFFLSLVDTLTVWHIKILQFLEQPGFGNKQGSFDRAFPELTWQELFRDQLFRDLHIRGMINFSEYAIISRMDSENTQLGNQFLEFISSSVEE
jgi:hypothetical protein